MPPKYKSKKIFKAYDAHGDVLFGSFFKINRLIFLSGLQTPVLIALWRPLRNPERLH